MHASTHVLRGHPEDLLWVCNVGALLVALGLLARRPAVTSVGALWLAVGTPLWITDLSAAGGQFLLTSLLPHLGSLALGVWSACKYGMPRHTWWRAVLGLVALFGLTRLVTSPAANVNMAFQVYAPAQRITRSYPVYWAGSMALFALAFALLERFGRRLAAR